MTLQSRPGRVGDPTHWDSRSTTEVTIPRGKRQAASTSIAGGSPADTHRPDPKANKAGEYAAIVVSKILDYPPFTPTVAREFTAAGVALLKGIR